MAIQNTGGVFENGEGGSLDFMLSLDGVHAEALRRHGAASFNQHLGGADWATFGEQILQVMYAAFLNDRTILPDGDDDDPDDEGSVFDPEDFPSPQEGDVSAGEAPQTGGFDVPFDAVAEAAAPPQTEGASAVDGIGS